MVFATLWRAGLPSLCRRAATAARAKVSGLDKVRGRRQIAPPGPARAGGAEVFVLPTGALVAAGTYCVFGERPTGACDEAQVEVFRSDADEEHWLEKLRGVSGFLRATSDLDAESFQDAGRAAFAAAVGPDGRIKPGPPNGGPGSKLSGPLGQGPAAAASAELVPVLCRLIDANGNGVINEREFLAGQALVFAAATSHDPAALGEACWRALDGDRDGLLSRKELEVAVRFLVRVRAVRPEDRKQTIGQLMKVHKYRRPGRFQKLRSAERLVEYYMDMYDANQDGCISQAEFRKHSALQEDFFLLINSTR